MGQWFPAHIGHYASFLVGYEDIYILSYAIRFLSLIYLFSLIAIKGKREILLTSMIILLALSLIIIPVAFFSLSMEFATYIRGFEIFRVLNTQFLILNNINSFVFMNLCIPVLVLFKTIKKQFLLSIVIFSLSLVSVINFKFNISVYSVHIFSYISMMIGVLSVFLINGINLKDISDQ